MSNTAPAALRNIATIGFFFACACAPWLAAAFVFNPVRIQDLDHCSFHELQTDSHLHCLENGMQSIAII